MFPWPNPIRNFVFTSVGKIPKHSELEGNNCDALLKAKSKWYKATKLLLQRENTWTHTPSSSSSSSIIWREKEQVEQGKRRKDLIKPLFKSLP